MRSFVSGKVPQKYLRPIGLLTIVAVVLLLAIPRFGFKRPQPIVLENVDSLKKFVEFGGFWKQKGGVLLADLDLRSHVNVLNKISFDSRTKWPEQDKMPEGFDPAKLLEEGKNPGLGVRQLHEQGIDGRGVGIAILDQRLVKNHREYVDQLFRYEEINVSDMPPQMHGPPVASIAVGKTCGVAPGATLSYFAMRMTAMPDNKIYCDIINKIIDFNRSADVSEQVRVISISTGTFRQQANFEQWKKALKEAEQNNVLVVTCAQDWLSYGMLAHIPGTDSDDPYNYRGGKYGVRQGALLVPAGNRTTASHHGPDVYTYWTDDAGMSWAAPYIAGLAALAFQVNPDLQPQTILEQLVKTATHTKVGPVVNPIGFIEAVRKAMKDR